MSLMQDTVKTAVAAQTAQPTHFFSLPGELRNQIYDILHQHEKSTRFHSLTFRKPLSHIRLISHQFTDELDKRAPAVVRLVISQTNKNQLWYPTAQPARLPKTFWMRIGLRWMRPVFNELEVNFHVCDTYHEPHTPFLWFHEYSRWLSKLFHCERHIASPADGGQLHLRLFFNYMSNMGRIQNAISSRRWYDDSCVKISLIYDGDRLLRAQTVATRCEGSRWENDETAIEKCLAEWDIGRLQADRVALS